MSLLTMDDIAGQATLTTRIQTLATEDTDAKFGALWGEGMTEKQVPGEEAKWDEIRASRGLAPITGLMSPIGSRPVLGRFPRSANMFKIAETRKIPWNKLFIDRAHGELKDNARATIDFELKDMAREMNKTKELARSKALTGSFVVAAGTPPGSDLPFTLTFNVTALTKNASWAVAATPIVSDEIPRFQDTMIAATGRAMTRGIINNISAKYLLGNTEVQNFARAEADAARRMLESDTTARQFLPGIRVGGIAWDINAYGYKATPAAGLTKWVADSKAILLPEDLSDVLMTCVGRQAVPNERVIGQVDGDFPELQYGDIAWAKWVDNHGVLELHLFSAWYGVFVVSYPEIVGYAALV